jgi:hypothetical protein
MRPFDRSGIAIEVVTTMVAESGELAVRRDALMSEQTDLVRAIAYQLFRRQNHVDECSMSDWHPTVRP